MVDGKNWHGMSGHYFLKGKIPVEIHKTWEGVDNFQISKSGKHRNTYGHTYVTNKRLKKIKLQKITEKEYEKMLKKKWSKICDKDGFPKQRSKTK
jgi:hypothetical protein